MSNITRNAIVNSFKLVAAKKEIKDITIQEITANCGLKRQTFYNYFQDKYDLIKWMYLNEVVLKIEQDDTWIEKYKELFNYCLTNKNMVLNIYYTSQWYWFYNNRFHLRFHLQFLLLQL